MEVAPVTKNKRFVLLNDFEYQQKKKSLQHLTVKKSLEIFKVLYLFGQGFIKRDYYWKFHPLKIKELSQRRKFFMKLR